MASSADIAKSLAAYDKKKQSSADILNSAMSQYGVPEIRNRVAGLRTTLANTETALNNVDPSVTGRTSRSLVTEAQRQRMVSNERAPIAAQYGDQSKALTTESANLTDAQQAAQTLAQGKINDYTAGRDALKSQYEIALARETEARRRAEADRAFKLEKTNADRSYALSASKAASGGASSKKTDVVSSLTSDILDNIKDFKNRPSFWTEKTLIPQLVAAYPELSNKEITDKVYQLRKQYE